MKKALFVLAVGMLVLASCQSDEIMEQNLGQAISFKPLVTKATSTTSSTISEFTVTSMKGTAAYFGDVQFTKNGDYFTSVTKYYWPAEGNLDFFAFNPSSNTQVSKTDYKTFVVTPDAAAASQVDFLYANTNGWNSENGKAGVTINFRHAESQVVVKVLNSDANLIASISDVKLNFLSKKGTFTYADTNTDGNNSSTLSASQWTIARDDAAAFANNYAQTASMDVTSTAAQVGESWIVIPQTVAKAAKTPVADPKMDGAFISFNVVFKNATDKSVIYSGVSAWPVDFTWAPGYKYTYTVDLGGGGYYPEDPDEDPDEPLDPILSDNVIKFVTVTVDEWVAASEVSVGM